MESYYLTRVLDEVYHSLCMEESEMFMSDNIVFYLLLMLSFVNKINSYLTFILFNPLVYVVFALFRILVVLCFFTSNLYYECVK